MKPCFLSLLSPGVTCNSLSLLVPLRHACTPRAREDAEEPGEHPQRLPPAREVGPPAPGVPCAWERVVPGRPPTCRIRRGVRAAPAEGGAGPPGLASAAAACNPGFRPATVPLGRGPGLGTVLVVTTGGGGGSPTGPWQAGIRVLLSTPQLTGPPHHAGRCSPDLGGLRNHLQPGRPEAPGPSPDHEDASASLSGAGGKGRGILQRWASLSKRGMASTFP